jgi:undecaprenyl-diphosphatase
MKIITNIGSVVGVLTIFIISIIVFKDKTTRIMLLSNITLIGILSLVLKTIFSRERPLESIIKMPTSYSFPSGHTFFAVGFYGLIVYFISKSNIKKSIKTLLIIISSLLIFLIGFSRIYLGVHHFTDVIGGLIYGLLILIIFINTYQILKEETK